MFSFFKKNKISIDSLTLPDQGWELTKSEKGLKTWENEAGSAMLSLHYFDQPPDLPGMDISILRSFYRNQIVSTSGGLIEVKQIEIRECMAIRTLCKIPINPSGMAYVGSITLPFRKSSFVVKIQAVETGITGMREAIISDKLLQEEVIGTDDNPYAGWAQDPYDDKFQGGTLKNKSEEAEYDQMFPEHPLSVVRQILNHLENSIELSESVQSLEPFVK